MHIVTKARLREFWLRHPEAEGPLQAWNATVCQAKWRNFGDVRRTYCRTDVVKGSGWVVFNVNSNRIVADIAYSTGFVFIKEVFTHREYDEWNDSRR